MSEDGPHAMRFDEKSPDHQPQKITALDDGLRDHDGQRGIQEGKAVGE